MEIVFEKLIEEGIEVIRCRRCKGVAEDESSHVCPPTADEVAKEQEHVGMQQLLADIGDEALPVDKRMESLRTYTSVIRRRFDIFVSAVERKYPDPRKVVAIAIDERLAGVKRVRDRCYEQYDTLRRAGIPLEERRKRLDHGKIQLCDAEERKLIDYRKRMPVKSWGEILREEDQGLIMRMGLRSFIGLILEDCFFETKQSQKH